MDGWEIGCDLWGLGIATRKPGISITTLFGLSTRNVVYAGSPLGHDDDLHQVTLSHLAKLSSALPPEGETSAVPLGPVRRSANPVVRLQVREAGWRALMEMTALGKVRREGRSSVGSTAVPASPAGDEVFGQGFRV